MKIADNIALVVGGGSGMGEAVCHYLAEQGAKIIVIDKSENAALQVAHATQGKAIACDITEEKGLEDAFVQIQHTYAQPLSIAINCAGIAPAQRIVSKKGPVSLSWFENVIKVNLMGTFNVMRLAAS